MNYYGNCSAIYAILVFQFDNSGCGLFQILWILYSRTLSFNVQYFTPDTDCWCTRYTSLSTPDSALPSRALMHWIISEPSLQDVYLSSPVVIGLPAFGLCHLTTTLAIQWKSWRLITRRESRLYPTDFLTSPPTVVLKSGKPYISTSKQSVNRLNYLNCICMSEWKYNFQVIYVF